MSDVCHSCFRPPDRIILVEKATIRLSPTRLIDLSAESMHELAVTESILEIALRHGRAAGATVITDLFLVVGELSTIVDESVQFYWDIVSEGTEAAGATLHFRRVPGRLACRACGHTYSPSQDLPCPACSGIDIAVLAGEEFYLESIEVETTADRRQPTTDLLIH